MSDRNSVGEPRPGSARALGSVVLVVLALNVAFSLIAMSTNMIPQRVVAERIRQAFESGDLVEQDYLRGDTRRGQHQYNDCVVLQMLANPDVSVAGRAFGPWIHFREPAEEACSTLRQLFVEPSDSEPLTAQRYTRYWHGYVPATGFLLSATSLANVRRTLRLAVYGSVLLLLLAGFACPSFLPLTLPVGILGLLAWSLPTFGQGLTHAYGDAATMLGLVTVIAIHRRFGSWLGTLVMAGAFGSIVAYFDMLTGPLPVAAGLLFPAAYLSSRDRTCTDSGGRSSLWDAAATLSAFAVGAALTIGIHTGLVAAFVRPHGLESLWGNLLRYTQPMAATRPGLGWIETMGRLISRGRVLTGGSLQAWLVLLAGSALSWLIAAVLAWRARSSSARTDFIAFIVGSLSAPVWVALLQTHTYIHAGFMARIMFVPMALGFAAVLVQLGRRYPRHVGQGSDP